MPLICAICRDVLQSGVADSAGDPGNQNETFPVSTPCGHLFHMTCLRTWFRTVMEGPPAENRPLSCPYCKASVNRNCVRLYPIEAEESAGPRRRKRRRQADPSSMTPPTPTQAQNPTTQINVGEPETGTGPSPLNLFPEASAQTSTYSVLGQYPTCRCRRAGTPPESQRPHVHVAWSPPRLLRDSIRNHLDQFVMDQPPGNYNYHLIRVPESPPDATTAPTHFHFERNPGRRHRRPLP